MSPGNKQSVEAPEYTFIHPYASRVAAASWGPDFFHQADNFFTEVQQIIAIRNQLSPSTLLMINELGMWLAFWASLASQCHN